MLPSFRLIAATFLCGFAVVLAGLRVASSLNDMHEALPVMAANAAPVPAEALADPEMRRGKSAVPVMYDMRFVTSAASPAPMLANLTTTSDDLAVAVPPSAIEKVTREELPPPATTAKPQSKPGDAVAAIKPDAPAAAPADFDIPLPEPAAVDLSPSPIGAIPAETLPPEAKSAAVEPATDSPSPHLNPDAPTAAIAPTPVPKAKPAVRVKAKAKPMRKRRTRTARRTDPADPFGNSFGSPFTGTPQ